MCVPWGHVVGVPWGHVVGVPWGHVVGVPWDHAVGVKLKSTSRGRYVNAIKYDLRQKV